MDGEERDGWYRLFKPLYWAWQGNDMLEYYDVLARISVSKNSRSDDAVLDSVVGFRSGNWSYEWTQQGMHHQKKGKEYASLGNDELAKKSYHQASQFYSLASYPHLKTDELSIQAQLLAFSNYRKSFEYEKKSLLKEIKIPYQGKDIICYLHLPDDHDIHSVVIVTGGVETLQCDFFTLFDQYLAPAGIAMLTVDIPGCGFSSSVKLDQHSSDLHKAVIEHMKKVPWVDHDRIALMGMRFGGNIVTRLAFLEPNSIRAVVSIGGAVNEVFKKVEDFNELSPMMLDCLASRMQLPNSDADKIYQKCVPFSLVTQGLLSKRRIKMPILSIGHKDDLLCKEDDLNLIARASYFGEAKIIKKAPVFESYLESMAYSMTWLSKHLEE